jgi:hypothetical protein
VERLRQVLIPASCVPLLLITGGCGGARNDEVEGAAREFYDALATRDGARACQLLAPPTRQDVEQSAGKPCDQAIVDDEITPAAGTPNVEVYGVMGQVRWDGETTFLTRYQDGWRVLAAGCALPSGTSTDDTNDAGDPERYECSVKN